MRRTDPQQVESLRAAVAEAIRERWRLFLVQGLVLMALGLLAAALPQVSSLAVTVLVGTLCLLGGAVRLAALLGSRQSPGHRWSLLTAALAIVLGLVLLAEPLQGVLTLAIVLVVLFAIQGAASIFVALEYRRHLGSWGWVLASGLVDLALAALVLAGWPGSATWIIGLMVGLSVFFFGLALAMTALAARRLGNS